MNLTRSVLERLGHDSLVDLALSLSEELETHQERDDALAHVPLEWPPGFTEGMGKALDATVFHGTTGTKEPSPRGPRPAQTLLDDDPETDQQGGNTPEADQDRPDVSQDENDSQLKVEHLEGPSVYAKVEGEPLVRMRRRFLDGVGGVWLESPWSSGAGLYSPEDPDVKAYHRPEWVADQWGLAEKLDPTRADLEDDNEHA